MLFTSFASADAGIIAFDGDQRESLVYRTVGPVGYLPSPLGGQSLDLKSEKSSLAIDGSSLSIRLDGLSFWFDPVSVSGGKGNLFACQLADGLKFNLELSSFDYVKGECDLGLQVVGGERKSCSRRIVVNRWSRIRLLTKGDGRLVVDCNGEDILTVAFPSKSDVAKIWFGRSWDRAGRGSEGYIGCLDQVSWGADEHCAGRSKSIWVVHRYEFEGDLCDSESYRDFKGSPSAFDYVEGAAGALGLRLRDRSSMDLEDLTVASRGGVFVAFMFRPGNGRGILDLELTQGRVSLVFSSRGLTLSVADGESSASSTAIEGGQGGWSSVELSFPRNRNVVEVSVEGELRIRLPLGMGGGLVVNGCRIEVEGGDLDLDSLIFARMEGDVIDRRALGAVRGEIALQPDGALGYGRAFHDESRIYGYRPKFQPGPPLFLNGFVFMRCGKVVQRISADGSIDRLDFTAPLRKAYPKWDGVADFSSNSQTRVVADRDGWIYTFLRTSYRSETGLLKKKDHVLYSSDFGDNWRVLPVRGYSNFKFEFTGEGEGGAEYLWALGSQWRSDSDPRKLYLMRFDKSRGRLSLVVDRVLSENSNGLVVHSGDARQVFAVGDYSYITYSLWCEAGKFLPGNEIITEIVSKDGLKLGPPRSWGRIGSNAEPDSHHYAAVAYEGNSVAHLVLCGHNELSMRYLKIEVNGAEIEVLLDENISGGDGVEGIRHTYPYLWIRNGELHVLSRGIDSNYYFGLVEYVREGHWSSPSWVVRPFDSNYVKWYNKVVADERGTFLFYQMDYKRFGEVEQAVYGMEWPEEELSDRGDGLFEESIAHSSAVAFRLDAGEWHLLTLAELVSGSF